MYCTSPLTSRRLDITLSYFLSAWLEYLIFLVGWPGGKQILVDGCYGAHKLVAYFQSMIFQSMHRLLA